ncbi:MAG: NOB1 family endonuclease [Promethearchaeota archaeon]
MNANFNSLNFVILDNTAFVSALDPNQIALQNPGIRFYITSSVYDEALSNSRSSRLIEIAEAQQILKVRDPLPESLKIVNTTAEETGDIAALSNTDQEIIALYIDLKNEFPDHKGLIISDDYSVQNTCVLLKIPYFSYQKRGIKKNIKWEIYCPNCYKTFPPKLLGKECDHCGATLKRRAYRGKKRKL